MPPIPMSLSLQRRNAAATHLPRVEQRVRLAGVNATPVLRAARVSGQMRLPFFPAGSRGG